MWELVFFIDSSLLFVIIALTFCFVDETFLTQMNFLVFYSLLYAHFTSVAGESLIGLARMTSWTDSNQGLLGSRPASWIGTGIVGCFGSYQNR